MTATRDEPGNASETVVCQRCHVSVPVKLATGIGTSQAMTWLCPSCVVNGGADMAFARIGLVIRGHIVPAMRHMDGGSNRG